MLAQKLNPGSASGVENFFKTLSRRQQRCLQCLEEAKTELIANALFDFQSLTLDLF